MITGESEAGRLMASSPETAMWPIIMLSTCPTVVGEGAVEPRHVDLRPFAVNDGDEVEFLYFMGGGAR